MALSREAFLAAADLAREEVQLPEMGGSVFVRAMTAGERDIFEQELEKFREGKIPDVRARLAMRTVCDADGRALFTTADVAAINAKCAPVLSRIFDVATRLSLVSKQDLDDMEKNSVPIPSAST